MEVITADSILDLLAARHAPPEWAFLRELRVGTGYGERNRGRWVRGECEQRLDAWAINHYPVKNRERVTYEVKVSASDYAAEVRNPLKRRAGMALSNLFYFVAPEGIINPLRILRLPAGCGLLVVRDMPVGLVVKEVVPAPWRDTPPPPWHFVSAIARRAT